ncbi:MAG: ROK family protein [Pasteurellaceae bacterium]|nr:ROK family protein [Pasteurellaceae bacterium]
MKTTSLEQKYQHLGQIYQLIEQFELISRTDLAKLSGFAPASMTSLTKKLLDHKLILERTAQNLPSRGRPAVGLSISAFYWQLLCITLSDTEMRVFLCDLSGTPIVQKCYPLNVHQVEISVTTSLSDFVQHCPIDSETLLAVSISVMGKLDRTKTTLTQLGYHKMNCALPALIQPFIHEKPLYLNEHFQLWLLTESTLGSLISHNDVIFLQLDETINLSVLLRGKLLHRDEHKRMSVDRMLMPKFSELSDQICPTLDTKERYQLSNQITFTALKTLIDHYLPNSGKTTRQKIAWLCEQIQQNHPQALPILEHIADNLSYMLLNLISIFSTEKIMLCSPLVSIKTPLFDKIREKINAQLLQDDLSVDLVTSQYEWNSPMIPAVAIKYEIYAGNLIQNIIKL